MARLKISVENGATIVTIDDEEVSGLTGFKLFCEGNNNGNDDAKVRFDGVRFGAVVECVRAEIKLEIDDALATAIKG